MVKVERNEPEGLVLTVQITCRPSDGASWEFTQSQLWMPSAGTWYFAAESPATSVAAQHALPQPVPAARDNFAGRDDDDEPAPPRQQPTAPAQYGSRNVVIPSNVPPWQRTR